MSVSYDSDDPNQCFSNFFYSTTPFSLLTRCSCPVSLIMQAQSSKFKGILFKDSIK